MLRAIFANCALALCLPVSFYAQTVYTRTARPEATIEVHPTKSAGYLIPRTIFGTFLEPILKSVYGGVWAQLLENPSFEENLWSAENIRAELEREPALAQASRIGLPMPCVPLDATHLGRSIAPIAAATWVIACRSLA